MGTPYDEQPTETSLEAAEAAHLAARDTVALDPRQPGEPPRPPDDIDTTHLLTVRIPRQRPPGTVRRGAPLVVAALVNTGWAALVYLVPFTALVVWARGAEGPIDWALSLRLVLGGWLLSHGVPLTVPLNDQLVTMALVPLGLAAFALWRVNRAGVHTTRAVGARGSGSVGRAGLIALTVSAVYGGFGLLAAAFVNGPGVLVSPWRALLHFALFGLAGGALGSVRATGALGRIARATPPVLRDGIRTGVVATLLVLASGAGAVGLAVAIQGGEATRNLAGFHTGLLGQVALTVVSLAFGPNFATWAAAYLLGPGFAAGTLPLTQLPVVAGIPTGPLRGAGWLLMVLPLLGGVVASALMVRRRLRPRRTRLGDVVVPRPRWWRLCAAAGLSGPVAGVLLGLVAAASGGALPTGGAAVRTGPVAWQVAAVAILVVGLGGLLGVLGAGVARWGGHRGQGVKAAEPMPAQVKDAQPKSAQPAPAGP
jgi:hypothetical protein